MKLFAHNHGPEEGDGVGCRERAIGECIVRELTAGEERSLERVAQLRGYAGQLRSALRDAYDNAPNGTVVHSILGNALAIPAPDSEAA